MVEQEFQGKYPAPDWYYIISVDKAYVEVKSHSVTSTVLESEEPVSH